MEGAIFSRSPFVTGKLNPYSVVNGKERIFGPCANRNDMKKAEIERRAI